MTMKLQAVLRPTQIAYSVAAAYGHALPIWLVWRDLNAPPRWAIRIEPLRLPAQ